MTYTAIVDGWWGSGKSTLRGLVDGHPQLFVSPVQDSLVGGLSADKGLSEWLAARDIVLFRKSLWGKTEYSRIERDALQNKLVNTVAGSVAEYRGFAFDFHAFDKAFVSKVLKFDTWTVDSIASALYGTMAEFWTEYPGDRGRFVAAVSMDNNYPNAADLIASSTKATKYMWVDRDSEGILATHARRRPIQGNLGTKDWGSKSVQDFIQDGEVERIERKRQKIAQLAQQHPDKFLVVPFDAMIMDTARIMDQVAAFLGIERLPILDRYTYCGSGFPGSENYVGKVNDSPEKAFQPDDLIALRAEVKRVQAGGTTPSARPASPGFVKRAARSLLRRLAD
jgi:hypothetical protein